MNCMKKRKSREEKQVERSIRGRKLFCIVLFILIVFSVYGSYVSFDYYDYLKGGLFICVAILLSIAFKMMIGQNKLKNEKIPIILSLIAFIVFVFSVMLPDYVMDDILYEERKEEYRWYEIKLYEKLPEPVSTLATIYSNTYDLLDVRIYDIYTFRFEDYIFECESMGYTIDAERNDYSYNAYNEEGYNLSLWFDKDEKEMEIVLSTPVQMEGFVWPDRGLGKIIPHPSFSDIGRIEQDSKEYFSVYVGNATLKDFDTYVNTCINEGFDIDYSRYDKSFFASNKDKITIHVEYKGNNTMYISVYTEWY